MDSRKAVVSSFFWVALAASVTNGAAQWDNAELVVTVRTADTQQPIAGAEVLLDGRAGGRTNADGIYRTAELRGGARTLLVRHLGYVSERVAVQLASERATRISVSLRAQPIPLAEIRVQGRSSAGMRLLNSRGFFARQRNSGGYFFTRAEIERSHAATTADLLARVPGVQISRGFGTARAIMGRGGSRSSCPVQYFVDGIPAYAYDLEEMRVEDLEGVEVYRGASQVPPEFRQRSAMCGVVVFWTRVD